MAGVPSRLAEIKRDLGAMAVALASRGGGGSASELRSDAGIFFGYGVEETLSRHVDLIDQDVEIVTNVVVGANATRSDAFSFPEDHYIQSLDFFVTSLPANLNYVALTARPQNQTQVVLLAFSKLADLQNFPGLPGPDDLFVPILSGMSFPHFMRANTDYTLTTRSNAGGSVTMTMNILRSMAPQGVRIAH